MKCTSLVLFSVLLAPPLFADAGEHIIPAGSLISCTTAEPRLSSKNTAVGDPVLCHLAHSERYGRATLPYNSYLVGRFEEYKDPGHFVGKGYMELHFDQLVIEPETEVPIDARVVDVTGYRVDTQGRILGKGHAVRDAVMWSIPVLWPIDLLMLPMRGPRPTLKEETRMTLKVMDGFAVPNATLPYTDPYGLRHRNQSYDEPPVQQQQPQQQSYQQPQYAPQPQPQYQPQYAPQPQYQAAPTYNIYQQPPVVIQQQPQVVVMQPPPPTYVYASPPPPPPVYTYGYGYGPPVWGVRAYGYRGW
jgi:hypothetical protein